LLEARAPLIDLQDLAAAELGICNIGDPRHLAGLSENLHLLPRRRGGLIEQFAEPFCFLS
jgi:hypothetical protein